MLYQGVLYRGTTVITDIQQLQGFAVQKKNFFFYTVMSFVEFPTTFIFLKNLFFQCFSKYVFQNMCK